MSRGPGRIERAIRALFDAHPDLAFTTDELAEHCYPGVSAIQRKHQSAVLRAAWKVIEDDSDWEVLRVQGMGRGYAFLNRASAPSYTMDTGGGPARRCAVLGDCAPGEGEGAATTHAPTAAELRRHSSWLLAHARQLREDAESTRVRAAERREQSAKAIAAIREQRRLSLETLNRHPLRYGMYEPRR